ncbi:MAG: polysaccharide biosynthesis protein [Oscillospiraceae bacterium]|nr:polysaccharide biosynthesis protein [Oscillospiraceae bacterium]
MAESKKQSYLHGAAILASTAILVKLIGAVFKIPLFNLLGDEGTGHFQLTYQIYTLLLTVSYSGIPVALSRLISAASETGRRRQAERYFSVALPAFVAVGAAVSLAMFIFAPQLAAFMRDAQIVTAIRVLSPAVFFCCVLSVYEGYAQGHGDMVPTALKQLLEVSCKLVIGLTVAWWVLRRAPGSSKADAAAGAITGVVLGLVLSLPVLIFYKRRHDRRLPRGTDSGAPPSPRGRTLLSIFKVSIPITLGASFMTIMTIIDARIVMSRLVEGAGVTKEQAVPLYGVYSKGLALLQLPSAFVVPVTVSIIPAISAAIAAKRRSEAREISESSMKLVNLIALPAGIGMFVLSAPIFGAMYGGDATGARILSIFGVASFFTCAQLITTAILQANGFERIPMLTYPIGGVIQIVCDWILVGNPNVGIIGSPVGTLLCYASITLLNFAVIQRRVKDPPRLSRVFVRPALIAACMGAAAWAVNGLLRKIDGGALGRALGSERLATVVYLAVTILIAVLVYGILIIMTKTVTREDMKLVPKGEKLAKILKIR